MHTHKYSNTNSNWYQFRFWTNYTLVHVHSQNIGIQVDHELTGYIPVKWFINLTNEICVCCSAMQPAPSYYHSCSFQGSRDELEEHLQICKFEGVKVSALFLTYLAWTPLRDTKKCRRGTMKWIQYPQPIEIIPSVHDREEVPDSTVRIVLFVVSCVFSYCNMPKIIHLPPVPVRRQLSIISSWLHAFILCNFRVSWTAWMSSWPPCKRKWSWKMLW